jgi:hypothetical protein
MRRLLKITATVFLAAILVCAISFFTDKNEFGNWTVVPKTGDSVAWVKFYWAGDTLNGKYYEKTAMLIPTRIEGLPYTFSFQFDLGDYTTEIYERNLASVTAKYPVLNNKRGRLKSPLQFWNSNKALKDLSLDLGGLTLSAENCMIKRGYGQELSISDANDTFQLGTIGADVFRNRVLIIDYPNGRFAICDTVPAAFATHFVSIEIDKSGMPILPMRLKGKTYRVNFDNGSSLFPLITLAKNMANFSSEPDTDTIRISSWGQYHTVTGRMLKDSFELGGQKFANVKVYANHSGLGIDSSTDGMTGNALFWDKTIIIDFRSKRFGVK